MHTTIQSKNAPEPIGPYSQAVFSGNTLYCSGQIALNPDTGELNTKDIHTETKQVLENLKAVLAAADMSFSNVVKCSIFIKSMEQFTQINEVYATYFSVNPPARETVEVAGLPKGVSVEISCIAVK